VLVGARGDVLRLRRLGGELPHEPGQFLLGRQPGCGAWSGIRYV
jgi:hypothetical protein